MGLLDNIFGATCTECGEYLPPEDFDKDNNYTGDHEHING